MAPPSNGLPALIVFSPVPMPQALPAPVPAADA
jgi:hypothetical protein